MRRAASALRSPSSWSGGAPALRSPLAATDALDSVAAGRMTVVPVDVTDRSALDAAAAAVRDELGEIDMVVFNAGFWEQMDAAAWDRDLFARHVEINLLGLNNCIGAVLPEMLRAGRGRLVERGVGGRLPRHHRRRGVRRHQGGPDQHAGSAPRRRGRRTASP